MHPVQWRLGWESGDDGGRESKGNPKRPCRCGGCARVVGFEQRIGALHVMNSVGMKCLGMGNDGTSECHVLVIRPEIVMPWS